MHGLTRWLARHPLFGVVAPLLLSVAAAALCWDWGDGRLRLAIDPSIERLLPPSDSDRAVFNRVRDTFGDADAVLVAVEFDSVYAPDSLAAVERLTRRFRELPGVSHVFSLATAPNLMASGDSIEVATFTEQARAAPARIRDFPRDVAANPIYQGSLVSADGRLAAFALSLSGVDEQAFRQGDYPGRIRALVRDETAGGRAYITGGPIIKAATTDALFDTLRFVIPLIFVLMVAVLGLAFRSLRATIVAVLTVGMALLWTLATVATLELSLNLVTVIMPPLVMTLGFAYAVHALSEFLGDSHAGTPRERLGPALERMVVPLFLTGGTTVAGFVALMPNPLPAIRQFAVLSAVGVTYAALLTLVFAPAALALVGSSRRERLPGEAWFGAWARRLAGFDVRNRRAIIAVGVLLLPLGLLSASKIRAGTEYIGNFPENAEVRRDYEAIDTAFNGANLISILIETHVNDALTDPELVRRIEDFQEWLRAQPEVGAAVSFVDHLKLINQNLNEGDRAFFQVPDSAVQIKQLLVFGGSEELARALDARMRTALISVRVNVNGSIAIRDLVDRIERRLDALPPPLNGSVTGSAVLATSAVDAISSGQWQSVLIGFAIIWAMLSMMFTSARAGLIAMLPNIIPVAVYFGALGVLGIGLNPTNSLIASIVLGIAVDDTIHFMARFNADARATGDEPGAVKSALSGVLRPITLNTLALCLGFGALGIGALESQAQFGLLVAFTLAMAWIADILLTPALGSLLRIVTLWDLLRLDLGRNPQHTIPLLSGLSLREARIFALMSKLEQHPEAARVIREGDWSRDMYVILDGQLQVFVERDGQRKPLATITRGAVMGETGYFGQRRTASVEAATPARVLRFDSQDLEQLRLRYPKIAATVFRNLNRIQAERLARTTAMIQ